MDFLPAVGPGVEDDIADAEMSLLVRRTVESLMPSLSEKEIFILENRLLTDEPATLREIGERYNVTRERIRQLEARLLEKLKEHLSRELKDFSEDWIIP
jgi:RNA polymerase sigma-32 factor